MEIKVSQNRQASMYNKIPIPEVDGFFIGLISMKWWLKDIDHIET